MPRDAKHDTAVSSARSFEEELTTQLADDLLRKLELERSFRRSEEAKWKERQAPVIPDLMCTQLSPWNSRPP